MTIREETTLPNLAFNFNEEIGAIDLKLIFGHADFGPSRINPGLHDQGTGHWFAGFRNPLFLDPEPLSV